MGPVQRMVAKPMELMQEPSGAQSGLGNVSMPSEPNAKGHNERLDIFSMEFGSQITS